MRTEIIEKWKPAPSAPRCYEVSNLGNVRRVTPGKNAKLSGPLRLTRAPNGYMACGVRDTVGKCTTLHIHREVARAFIGEPPPGRPYVNHRDSDRANNRVDNLEWCSQKENMAHARAAGRWFGRHGVPVVQLTTDGTVVRRYSSAIEAARQFAPPHAAIRKNISTVCNKVRRHDFSGHHPRYKVRGYLWIYETDMTEANIQSLVHRYSRRRCSNE